MDDRAILVSIGTLLELFVVTAHAAAARPSAG